MADVAILKVAAALGFGIILAAALGFVLLKMAESRGGRRLFASLFLTLVCVYALGFAARYVLIEVLP